jgi:hypothetical protein
MDFTPAPISTQPIGSSCTVASAFGDSPWFSISGTDALKPLLNKTNTSGNLHLSLALENPTDREITATVSFPALSIHVSSDPKGTSYLFPQKVATISSADQKLSADYGPDFLMQFTDVFSAQAHCGVAAVVEDTTGQPKTFVLTKAGA